MKEATGEAGWMHCQRRRWSTDRLSITVCVEVRIRCPQSQRRTGTL